MRRHHRANRRILILAVLFALLLAMLVSPGVAGAAPMKTTQAQREAAATWATRKVGAPYRAGFAGPGSFDCSGLVTFAFRAARAPLNVRTSFELWKLGARISRAGLKRGDLVWTYDKTLGHVGMYLGAGRYVHSPKPGRKVTIEALPKGKDFVGAVRP